MKPVLGDWVMVCATVYGERYSYDKRRSRPVVPETPPNHSCPYYVPTGTGSARYIIRFPVQPFRALVIGRSWIATGLIVDPPRGYEDSYEEPVYLKRDKHHLVYKVVDKLLWRKPLLVLPEDCMVIDNQAS